MDVANLVIQGLVALGTVGAVIAAIWEDPIRARFVRPKLALIGNNLDGDPTHYESGARAMFYTLKVTNEGRLAAKNCRVMLVGLSRRDPSGGFQPVPLAFPCQFMWTPLEYMPLIINITREQILDLGHIDLNGEKNSKFFPRLYFLPHNFRGVVGPNEAVRFQLHIPVRLKQVH